MAKRLYNILGVDENADIRAINVAYRKLALKWHPDRNTNDPKAAELKFQEIVGAYDILKDQDKRKKYDANQIDEKGQDIQPEQMRQAYSSAEHTSPRQNFKQKRAEPTDYSSSASPKQSSQSSNYPSNTHFFRPHPVVYYFFNTSEDALKFKEPKPLRNHPVFVYLTPSPLVLLLNLINENLKTDQTSGKTTTRLYENHNNQPPHVFVESNNMPQMEQVIDRLIANMIILELMQRALSQPRFDI